MLLIYECKRIKGWNLPLRQQRIYRTDSDFIVLFNLITVEAINIKKDKHLRRRCVFFRRNDNPQMNQDVFNNVSASQFHFTFLLLLCCVCGYVECPMSCTQKCKATTERTETQHVCTQITCTNMRCHVLK